MQIDAYCIDMHTSQGRKMGKNKADFAKEGCVVVDEDKEFYVKEWRDYYIQEKLDNFDQYADKLEEQRNILIKDYLNSSVMIDNILQ